MLVKSGPAIHSPMPLPEELIEAELPLTPVQEQLVSMILSRKEPEYTSFGISLPEHASLSFDLIRHAWRAVASHNAVLRTRLEIRGDRKVSVGGRQCVLRHIPDVQFCQRMTLSYSGHETARLVVDTSDNSMQASVWIHRALIDDSSVPLLCKDFDLFFSSIAFSHHASLEKFIQRVISRDRNAAKLFWRAQLAGISSAPIHGLPTETKALLSNVTGVMGKTKTDMLQNFAASANVSVPSVFYTAWASTLAVHTEAGNNRVTFSVFGRDPSSPHNLNVTGPCDQTYPLVISILPDQSAKDLASGIAQADKEASSHAFIGYRSILDQAPESLQQTLVHVRSSRKSFAVEVSTEIFHFPLGNLQYTLVCLQNLTDSSGFGPILTNSLLQLISTQQMRPPSQFTTMNLCKKLKLMSFSTISFQRYPASSETGRRQPKVSILCHLQKEGISWTWQNHWQSQSRALFTSFSRHKLKRLRIFQQSSSRGTRVYPTNS